MTKDDLFELEQIRTYEDYVKFCNKHKIAPKTETAWILDICRRNDSKLKQEISNINSSLISSGNQLIKARRQILSGLGCQTLGGILFATTYSASLSNGVSDPSALGYGVMIASGGLALTGIFLEISGIVNIGKAGISLNEHGIGVRVKF